jgi:LmbE family N-acetylglucosaminyl deacetylase
VNIVCFGAHPDDLEVGMGGAIAKYTQAGHEVRMVLLCVPNNRGIRLKEARAAAEILSAELTFLDRPPERLVFNRDLVRALDRVLSQTEPDEVYTHWTHDSHQDHNFVAQATLAAARKNTCGVYMYEQTIPGGVVPYSFRAARYVDISSVIDKKIESVLQHTSQVQKNGSRWLQGIRGRAAFRGFQIDVDYAEAFEVVKEIHQIVEA